MRAFHGLINGVVLSIPLWAAIVLGVVLLTGRPTASAPRDVTLPSTPEAISACVARTLGVAPPAALPTIEYVPAEKVAWYRSEADGVYLTTAQGTVFMAGARPTAAGPRADPPYPAPARPRPVIAGQRGPGRVGAGEFHQPVRELLVV